MILSVEGYERVSFSTSEVAHVYSFPDGKGGAVAEWRPRERENEIASRHAYEVDGRSNIKVVPSVRRGATANKWAEMFAKVASSAWQIIFHPCLYGTSRRTKEGERVRRLSMWRTVSHCQGQVGEKSPLRYATLRIGVCARKFYHIGKFIWRV